MDSSGVQIQLDPIAPPEAPKSRDVAPGKKRNEQGETRDTAAAAALTASFAEILQSKGLDPKTGAEGQATEESAIKTKKAGLMEGKEALTPVQSQLAAGKKNVKLPALEVQAKETLDHAKELAGQAMKTAPANSPGKDSADAAQPAELAKKGALTPAEEALLKEVIQKQGSVAGQKKAAQTTALPGERTRVETTVAMEFAASWKPFKKSKTSATAMMRTISGAWILGVRLKPARREG